MKKTLVFLCAKELCMEVANRVAVDPYTWLL